ncbi:MAG: GDSL-type esterase/lipase family protein [Desulfobaccales bacterium]|jgi:lysophospholipase L1-like esterase
MSRDPSRKTWFERHSRKVIFLVVLLAVCGLGLLTEKILAFRAGPFSHPLGVKRFIKLREFEPGYAEVLLPSPQAMTQSDTLVRRPYVIRVDEDGFIMPARVHEHPDLTLVFLGGSTTEDIYDDENNRFPYLVGRLLEGSTGLRVNSYNAAKSGNDSLHSLDVLLNKVLPLKPDLVVMMHNINDLSILLLEKSYWNKNPYRSPLIEEKPDWRTVGKNLQTTFQLARDLVIPNLYAALHRLLHAQGQSQTDEFQAVRGQKIEVDQDVLVREFTYNLQTFINICRARGITPVLMTMPSRLKEDPDPLIRRLMQRLEEQNGITYRDFKGAFDRFNQTIREVAGQNRVDLVDLAQEIPQEKEYMSDVVHFNPAGSRLVAQKIAAGLSPLLASIQKRPAGR